jgi:5-hydroxyisourate hydrolase-like protein (transthyretin family)
MSTIPHTVVCIDNYKFIGTNILFTSVVRSESVKTLICVCRITDADGYCSNLLRMNEVVAGRYKMHFEVKKYFTLGLHDTFYPFIEVSGNISNLFQIPSYAYKIKPEINFPCI